MKGLSAGLKVGLTAAIIAVAAFFAFKFVSKGLRGEQGYPVFALFRDATGLVEKSRVQVAGLTIGEITGRHLQGPYARVDLRIRPDTVLWSNSVIYKKSASLLGEFYLEIDPGTPDSLEPLSGKVIKNYELRDCYRVTHRQNCNQITNVIEAITTTDVLTQISETLPVLRDILKDVQQLTNGPLQDIARDVQAGIDRNSEAAAKLLEHIDQIAVNVKGFTGGPANQDLRKTMENVRDITDGVKRLVGTGEGQINSTADRIRTQLDTLSVTLNKVNQSLDDVAGLTQHVAKGEGTVGRLLKDETIAEDLTDIADDASSFIRSITRLQTIVGIREEWNILASAGKTYFSLKLQPRPDKYYLIELIDDPRGSRSYSHTFTSASGPAGPNGTPGAPQTITNTDSWTRNPGFRFSFMFAKRLELWKRLGVTGRIGIKESTGGGGLDLDLWHQRLLLQLDLFDFFSAEWPRFKVMAAIEFMKHVWLVGGVDDILNTESAVLRPGADVAISCGPATPSNWCRGGRDYFIGAMLTFNDEDLRALLTVGGSALSGAGGK